MAVKKVGVVKPKLQAAFILALLLIFTLAWAAIAQEPEPPLIQANGSPPFFASGEGERGSRRGLRPFKLQSGQLATTANSYRYQQTLGETEKPYTSTTVHLNRPGALAIDGSDNVYIGEWEGQRVLQFNSAGVFQAQIGYSGLCRASEDGWSPGICEPNGLAVGTDGQLLIAEGSPSRIAVFTYTTAAFTFTWQIGETWNWGSSNALFRGPAGVAQDSTGRIYVADQGNSRVQIFNSSGGYLTTIGSGTCGSGATELCEPYGLAIGSGGMLYIADTRNSRVQIYQMAGNSPNFVQSITTGSGPLEWVTGVAVDANYLYVSDHANDGRIQVFDLNGVYQYTIAGDRNGDDDCWDDNDFCWPEEVAVDSQGNVYIADTNVHFRVTKCSGGQAGACAPFAGTQGIPYITNNYHYFRPYGITLDSAGNILFTEEYGRRLFKLDQNGAVQVLAGEAGIRFDDADETHFGQPYQVAIAPNGLIYVADGAKNRVQIFNPDGTRNGILGDGRCDDSDGIGQTEFCWPRGVAIGSDGRIYVADGDHHRVQVFDGDRNYLATIGQGDCDPGNGIGGAEFCYPAAVAVDESNNVYVADYNNFRVQKCQVAGSTGTCTTFLGVTGQRGQDTTHLDSPNSVTLAGNRVFVADQWNNRVQVFGADGAYITTIGTGWGDQNDELRGPAAVAVDAAGNVYVTDWDNHRIQKFAPSQEVYLPLVIKS